MKKLILGVAVLAAVMMGACSNKDKGADAAVNESAIATKIENCTNPDSLKVYVEQVKDYADRLVKDGKVAEAQRFLDKITPVVQTKAPALAGVLETAKATIAKLPGAAADSLKNASGAAVDSIGNKVGDIKDAVVDKAEDVAGNVKDAATGAVNDVKDGATDIATRAAEGTANTINKVIH